jgi:hypothetical protein
MISRAELRLKLRGNGCDTSLGTTIDVQLKRLRKERRLVERAIRALTEVSQTRQSRARLRTNRSA